MRANENYNLGYSDGLDLYIQLFTNNLSPYISCLVAWPNKTLIEKTKTFSYNYSSNGIIPIEIDTGFTENSPVYNLTARTETSWPQFEGLVELVYDK